MLEYPKLLPRRSHKVIILLVKDAKMGKFLLRVLSREKRYHVMLFSHEHQVLRILCEVKPDLLIFDSAHDEQDGWELSRRFQTMKGLEKVPALFSNLSTRFLSRQKKPVDLLEYDEPSTLESFFYTLQEVLVE